MPSTTNSSSARRERSSASSRVRPVTMSLASIESKRPADDVALDDAGVEPHAGAGRRPEDGDVARGGQEVAAGVLAVDPELDGVPADSGSSYPSSSPSAMRNCSRTRSMPVTSSVTGCSTWRRVLTSRKEIVPSWPTRNSQVPAPA